LGAGGYGFVMTAHHRLQDCEVAVKFIIKSKVPEHAWMEDKHGNRVPTEALLLGLLDHQNIVGCIDLFEDPLYFYLSQQSMCSVDDLLSVSCSSPSLLSPALPPRPHFIRRPSHDLFECIEQSQHKRLTEVQARYIFAQVVDVVHYLDSQGVTHCDIKDENILVDARLRVKLVDFGSAVVVDPALPRPFYTLFFGTTAYAASEVLLKKPYQAPPAEIWTLGVLLSYLLTGASPFPTEQDAVKGCVVLSEAAGACVSMAARALMLRCLNPDPEARADIKEVRDHVWLR
ncbi:hypothetical protein HETIRDRAFT_246629, partial [Heterobasidion irregulare TC 32-1]